MEATSSSLLDAVTTTSLTGSPDTTKEIAVAILSKIPDKMMTMKYAYEYIFTTTIPIFDVHRAISPLFQHLLLTLYDSIRTLLLLIGYILLIIAKLLILAFPHAMKFGKVIYEFHRTQLTTMDIIIEVVALSILFIVLVFRRRIMSWWIRVEAYISAKSKAAAKAASHVIFFTTAFTFAILGKKFILPLTSSAAMPIFTLLIPLLSTIWWSRKYQLSGTIAGVHTETGGDTTAAAAGSQQFHESDRKMLQLAEKRLILWVILGIYHGMVTALSMIPFSNRLLSFLPYMKEMVIVVLIWIQLSPVFTDIVFASIISPLMTRLANYIPTTSASRSIEEHTQQASTIFTALKMMRLINDNQIRIVRAILQDTVVSVMALVFIFVPYPFSTVGVVTISLFLPAFRSVTVTNMIRHRLHPHHSHGHGEDREHGHRSRSSARSAQSSQNRVGEVLLMSLSNQWINYWICIGVFWLVKIYVLNFWPSVTIATALWLQHSYFNGATTAIEGTYSTFCVMMERNKAMHEERQRERARELEQARRREEMDRLEREQDAERQQRIGGNAIPAEDQAIAVETASNPLTMERTRDNHAEDDLDGYITVSPPRTLHDPPDHDSNIPAAPTAREVSESQRDTLTEDSPRIRRRGGRPLDT